MNRKAGLLLPLEYSVLFAADALRRGGSDEVYGYLLAKEMKDRQGALLLTAHGTLYKALDRLVRRQLLVGRWEDPRIAARDNRPRRRLYRLTSLGEQALANAPAVKASRKRHLIGRPAIP